MHNISRARISGRIARGVAGGVFATTMFASLAWGGDVPGAQVRDSTTPARSGADLVAQAGPASTSTAQDQPAAAEGGLQEVVVTAERRATDVQTTPIAVTALSGDQLAKQQVTQISNLQVVAPSLSINGTAQNQMLNMRGVGSSVPALNGVSTGVSVITDGVINPGSTGLTTPFFDIADVEVLRGPQGTFVGANSTGGAIQISSQNPTFGNINGYGSLQVGNYSDVRAQAAINLPATDTLALRLAVNGESENSFFFTQTGVLTSGSSTSLFDPGNVNSRDARLGLLWKPSSSFQALLKLQTDTNRTDGFAEQPNLATFTPLAGQACPNGVRSAVCNSQYYSGYSGKPWLLNYADPAHSKVDSWDRIASLELRYTLPDGVVLRSMTGYEEYSNSQVVPNTYDAINGGYTVSTGTPQSDYNSELDVISPDTGRLTWIGGASWLYRGLPDDLLDVNSAPPYSVAGPFQLLGTQKDITRSSAVFGQIIWHFTDTLELQAGARENWDNNYASGGFTVHSPLVPFPIVVGFGGTRWTGETLTGKAGLNWKASANQYVYAFYARGYKPGAPNLAPPSWDREHLDDYEAGLKSRWLDGHMTTQIGAYWNAYHGMQEIIYDISAISVQGQVNLPTATIKGLEASMQTRLGGFGFDLSAAYTDSSLGAVTDIANYKFNPAVLGKTNQCAAGQVPNATNSNCTNYLPYEVNLSGEELPFAPKLTVNASVQYAIPFGNGTLTPQITYSHTDRQYSNLFQSDAFYLMAARNLWNGYLNYASGPWTAGLYCTNLTNKLYITGNSATGAGSAGSDVTFGAPRQYGAQLQRSF
jgi:iron complex outermembrane receptor protein